MRKIFTLLFSLFCFPVVAQIPVDTSGGRYWNEIFPNVTISSNVTYGSAMNVSNVTQTLAMDIYEPGGDTVQYRPLLIFAHGGSFLFGTKNDQDVTDLCTRFAKMGYVCVSMDYRLGLGFPIDSTHAGRAVIRAVQDMKAAVRFFRKDFTIGNTYHIHPDFIFAGGSSAGAFTALHLAYMDSADVPSYLNISNLGGIEGTSGSPGYPSDVLAVINLCGALGDSTWIQAGDIAFVSMHGDVDQTVPYGSSTIYLFSVPLLTIDGSASLNIRAASIGVNNPFYPWWGADHVPYAGTGAAAMAYMDTTVDFIKAFLRPYFGTPVGIHETTGNTLAEIRPNPATHSLLLRLSTRNFSGAVVRLTDITGKTTASLSMKDPLLRIDVSSFARGIYLLEISGEHDTIRKKIVLE